MAQINQEKEGFTFDIGVGGLASPLFGSFKETSKKAMTAGDQKPGSRPTLFEPIPHRF
jgi:hypothetical protein